MRIYTGHLTRLNMGYGVPDRGGGGGGNCKIDTFSYSEPFLRAGKWCDFQKYSNTITHTIINMPKKNFDGVQQTFIFKVSTSEFPFKIFKSIKLLPI